jgi:CRP/FNR family cyclic AMP-dependent transcriptional regulator
MISPELLRRYPFFGFMSDHCLKTIAMHAEEEKFNNGDVILEEGQEAIALYFLMEGGVALLYDRSGSAKDQGNNELHVGDINAGEPFGISALIEPYMYTATVKATHDSRVIRIEASAIKELCMVQPEFAFKLMKKIASAAIERLNATRIQLAAAYA